MAMQRASNVTPIIVSMPVCSLSCWMILWPMTAGVSSMAATAAAVRMAALRAIAGAGSLLGGIVFGVIAMMVPVGLCWVEFKFRRFFMSTVASQQIHCFKCRTKTDTNDPHQVVLKNGRDAVTGSCAVCGTKKFRMGKGQA